MIYLRGLCGSGGRKRRRIISGVNEEGEVVWREKGICGKRGRREMGKER